MKGQTLTFGTAGEAKHFPHGTAPQHETPALAPACLSLSPFPCVWGSQKGTKPRAGDTPSLPSLTPSHTPFPLFSTLSNYPKASGDDSVTLMIKGSYGQENLVSRAIQPNSLDGKTGLHLCPNQSQHYAGLLTCLGFFFRKSSQEAIFA